MRAERAEEVAGLDELVEAALVDEVVARRDLRGLAGGVDVLLADGAVGAREVLDALQEERKRVRGQFRGLAGSKISKLWDRETTVVMKTIVH